MKDLLNSSVGRKQVVAFTGLLLILFVIGHLAGNLLIFLGPEAFNNYAQKLSHLRPGLYLIELGLLVVFLIHMYVTALLVWENHQARLTPYVRQPSVQRSLAARLMPYTGTIILVFVIAHLCDFTFVDKHGPRSILPDGKSYDLYGVVYNSFADPAHSSLYILAMMAVGFHLSHGLQSFFQTFGFFHQELTPCIRRLSNVFGLIVALAYSFIPVYVMLNYHNF